MKATEWSLKAVPHVLVKLEVKCFSASMMPVLPPVLETALDGNRCEEGVLGVVPKKH